MEKSMLKPYLRDNLDILFVGLNPATGSSRNKHYFSVNQSFWKQLFKAELIKKNIDKLNADEQVFGNTNINFDNWEYGITDLITEIAESDSQKIKPTKDDCKKLKEIISDLNPKIVIILHAKVLKNFMKYLDYDVPPSNSGQLRKLISNCSTMFFNIAFPHGNTIVEEEKIKQYKLVKNYLQKYNKKK